MNTTEGTTKTHHIHSSAQIHPNARVESDVLIGPNTRIWAFSHILSEVTIGADCNICDHTLLESGVKVGDRVTIKSGVYLWTGVELADDVFVGPCVAFTNDRHPRSRQYLETHPKTKLWQGCSIGANATLLPGIEIGCWAMIGAGSVVTRSVPDYGLVFGNPAKLQGWVCQCGQRLEVIEQVAHCACGSFYRLQQGRMVQSV